MNWMLPDNPGFRAGRRLPALALALLACGLSLGAVRADAQMLPSDPLVFADGRARVGADMSASRGADDPGFFNYTDYEHSSLRLFRIALTGSVDVNAHFSILGDVRSENLDVPRVYGLYARVRPWIARRFDIQIGRVPPTFGVFAREIYASDNPLIGYPLAYQYLTSLRADALPANADDLIRMRGRGWRSSFQIGNLEPDHGVPLVSAFRWDTGVQVHAANELLEGTASVTQGTLSNPLSVDNNGGKQVAGRAAVHPIAGLVLGVSAARGAFFSDAALRAIPASAPAQDLSSGHFAQTAWGTDVEYSQAHYLLRAETVWSEWRLPMIARPFIDTPLRSFAVAGEGRYRLWPGLYVAARVEHLGFSDVTGTAGPASWDADVSRVEVGGGYSLQRNLVLKVTYQYNKRDGGLQRTLGLPGAQLVYWF
jgi:hypothetical protein